MSAGHGTLRRLVLGAALMACADAAIAQHGAPNGEWPHFGGDLGNTKYSPLDQIGRDNWRQLAIAWRWRAEPIERVAAQNPAVRPGQFKPTPLVLGGRLFLATSLSQAVALDAATGALLWEHDPESWRAGRPANVGFQHRGVASWRDGDKQRIVYATGDRRLLSLDAATGQPVLSFGEGGAVSLEGHLDRERVDWRWITHSSPPIVCRDRIIVGAVVHDGPTHQQAPPGHVRAFDARTGALAWVFHTVPLAGEAGNETWEGESWRRAGAANVWTMMAADEELGLVYLPTSTPTNDFYGGHRLGDNLFAESLVALDCASGRRVWHFQAVRHGLWDYDFPTAPTLFDLEENGTVYRGIAAPSKTAWVYVFDRRTGAPRWPIEDRPVPASTVPDERAAATQPFPTRPAPFDRQGLTVDDLIDFTPELRAEALAILARYAWGPMFLPPTLATPDHDGAIQLPGASGGALWPGAALDPATGVFYVPSITNPMAMALRSADPARSDFAYILRGFAAPAGPRGLPLTKPPYGRVTAIDLRSGDHRWMTPHGEGPRDHPALRHLELGPLGAHGAGPVGGGGPVLTRTLLFVGQGTQPSATGVDAIPKLNVFDKSNGQHLGFIELPADPYGNPVTYLAGGRQFVAVAVGGGTLFGGGGKPAEVVALALPRPPATPAGPSAPGVAKMGRR